MPSRRRGRDVANAVPDWELSRPEEAGAARHLHQPDIVALVAGLASVLGALLFLLADLTPLTLRPEVVVAVLLAALGIAGLSVGRRRLSRGEL